MTLITSSEKRRICRVRILFIIFIGTEYTEMGASYRPRVKRVSYRKGVVAHGEIVVIIRNVQILCNRFGYLVTRMHRDVDCLYTRSAVSTTVNLLSNTYFELTIVVALLTDPILAPL